MATPTTCLWGAGAAATAYAAAAQIAGWRVSSVASRTADRAIELATNIGRPTAFTFDSEPTIFDTDLVIVTTPPSNHAAAIERIGPAPDVLVVAPLAATLSHADAMMAMSTSAQRLFGWPLVSAPTTQELMRRARSVGSPTTLSMMSSRPLPDWGGYSSGDCGAGVLQFAGHDHIALSLLLAEFLGVGAPQAVSAAMATSVGSIDLAADVQLHFADGFVATVHADWQATDYVRSEMQLSGESGVLRVDSNPVPTLEHNGEQVTLPRRSLADEQLRPLHDAGLIDLMKTVAAQVTSSAPLPHAFTFAFGREVCEVIAAAYTSAGNGGGPTPLPFTGPRDRSALELLHP